MGVLAITQARFGSSRFPGKVLKKVGGRTILEIHLRRLLRAQRIGKVVVATTDEPEAEEICAIARSLGVDSYRGSLHDVLDRYYHAAVRFKGEVEPFEGVLRATSDCTLIDPSLIDQVVNAFVAQKVDYCSNNLEPSFPIGVDHEVFRFSALERAWKEAKQPSEREHVTPYIWKNSSVKGGTLFTSYSFRQEREDQVDLRMVVDEPSDLEIISRLVAALGDDRPWQEYADYLAAHPELRALSAHITRYGSYLKSLDNDRP